MKRLTKEAYVNHDRDAAVVYIDGEISESEMHGDVVAEFVCDHPEFRDPDGEVWQTLNDDFCDTHPIAFAYRICKDIVVSPSRTWNMSVDELISKLRVRYPDAEFYDDDSYTQSSGDLSNYKKIARRK